MGAEKRGIRKKIKNEPSPTGKVRNKDFNVSGKRDSNP